ncbi:helix-turn-helix transcriptional regulator [Ruminococcus sp. Marseille-P6503]|uniref:helix-turn-helix domain-containing protein n=1 Tax=Ruminococcus sp. Marseille-P6503 TaxID=2364796 RepID=UPI000F549D28|nr:helix-turn-helix transcriptional regulator [Ruminococcus sp. Marseille-P6503]
MESTVGERLKKVRIQKGIKISEIANELGISERAYRNYESNERDLSTMTLLKICLYFDISSEYILGISEQIKSPSPVDGKRALELKLESLSTDSLIELDKFMDYLLWKEEQ